MTYNQFLKVVLTLQKQNKAVNNIYKNSVDLTNFLDPYYVIIEILITEVYGELGASWFNWFCFDNDFGHGTLSAKDENGNPICFSFESLWEYLETNYNQVNKSDIKN